MLKVGRFPAILLSVPEFQNVLAKLYNKQFYPIQVDMGHKVTEFPLSLFWLIEKFRNETFF